MTPYSTINTDLYINDVRVEESPLRSYNYDTTAKIEVMTSRTTVSSTCVISWEFTYFCFRLSTWRPETPLS